MIAFALTLLTVVAAGALMGQQRRLEGSHLAANAILSLHALDRGDSGAISSEEPTANTEIAMLKAETFVDAYVESDLGFHAIARHVDRAWLAYRVSYRLLRDREEGELSPLLVSVPGGEEAVAAFPEIAPFVEETQGLRRFVNTDVLAKELEARSARETLDAKYDFDRRYPMFSGLDSGEGGAANRSH